MILVAMFFVEVRKNVKSFVFYTKMCSYFIKKETH